MKTSTAGSQSSDSMIRMRGSASAVAPNAAGTLIIDRYRRDSRDNRRTPSRSPSAWRSLIIGNSIDRTAAYTASRKLNRRWKPK